MLDALYENIGKKIKSWAKWIFIVEAVSAIIGGLTLIVNEEVLYGWLVLIVGPIVAFISTWLLYAFGEITEDISLMRQKYVGDKDTECQKGYVRPKPPQPSTSAAETMDPAQQARITSAWDHWNEEYCSIGQCEVCGKKGQSLVYAEYQTGGDTYQKNLCFDCFSKRVCNPVSSTK